MNILLSDFTNNEITYVSYIYMHAPSLGSVLYSYQQIYSTNKFATYTDINLSEFSAMVEPMPMYTVRVSEQLVQAVASVERTYTTPFSLPTPYTTTIGDGTLSEVISYISTNVNGNAETRTTTSTLPPPFSLPEPYTTTVVNDGTTISEVISFISTNINGSPATETSISVIPPPYSQPTAYNTTLVYDDVTVTGLVSFSPKNAGNGLTKTAAFTSLYPVDRTHTFTATEIDIETSTTTVTDAAATTYRTVWTTTTAAVTVKAQTTITVYV
ncbi:hypothetical protein NCAS_0B00320 [Naumovozyma castellii]|uniref:Uncharacterized protein n=1 Tax=Naumovozyma castellii TaxID=27288 RepID=G0VAZ3_NAUCA|nr:hypothetical protein NCAS_0B00320 [Naumovozyma castellii CBS 4309]CCC68116.1 hypothetical protein NCAS_0B00320 [Naumovozyma castellii CBS 4309]